MKTSTHIRIAAACALLVLAAPALAQSNIDQNNKFAWGENIGWLNWRDAEGGAQGVRVDSTHLSGFIWAENVGWINTGSGPASGAFYANTDGSDAGVNILPSGFLDGLAWGENIGWVNFGTEPFIGAPGARYDAGAGRFRGFAWGENIGWINLDDTTRFVGVEACPWDLTGDGAVGSADLGALLGCWGNNPPPLCQAATFGSVPPQVGSAQLAKLLGNWGPCP